MQELHNLATSNASGEEAVHANFGRSKGKAPAEHADKVKDHPRWWKSKDKKSHDSEFIAGPTGSTSKRPARQTPSASRK